MKKLVKQEIVLLRPNSNAQGMYETDIVPGHEDLSPPDFTCCWKAATQKRRARHNPSHWQVIIIVYHENFFGDQMRNCFLHQHMRELNPLENLIHKEFVVLVFLKNVRKVLTFSFPSIFLQ